MLKPEDVHPPWPFTKPARIAGAKKRAGGEGSCRDSIPIDPLLLLFYVLLQNPPICKGFAVDRLFERVEAHLQQWAEEELGQ